MPAASASARVADCRGCFVSAQDSSCFLQALQWWYDSAEGKLTAQQVLSVPSREAHVQISLMNSQALELWYDSAVGKLAAHDTLLSPACCMLFSMQALEWWYDSAEGKLAAQQVLPVPPPPPPLPTHPDGLPLPADAADCAVCRRQRTNPALLEVHLPATAAFMLNGRCRPTPWTGPCAAANAPTPPCSRRNPGPFSGICLVCLQLVQLLQVHLQCFHSVHCHFCVILQCNRDHC